MMEGIFALLKFQKNNYPQNKEKTVRRVTVST
jgi:hypothetical protein